MPTYPYVRAKPAGWAFGEIMTSAQANIFDANAAAAADGSLWTDAAMAKNWPHKTTISNVRVVLYGPEQTTNIPRWRVVGTSDAVCDSWNGADWGTPTTLAPLVATSKCAVVNGQTVLIGGDPGGASAQKIARSTTGIAGSYAAVNSADTGTPSVECLTFFNSLYIAGLSNGAIETSPDGSTWTNRSVPNANARKEFATNGSILVCVHSASSDKYITSTDGTTWTERSFPVSATGWRIVYNTGLSKFFAVQQQATPTLYSSSDGISWNTVGNDASFSSSCILRSFGRVLVGLSGTVITVSTDGGSTWKRVATTAAGSGWDAGATDSVAYNDGRIVAIDSAAAVWATFRFT